MNELLPYGSLLVAIVAVVLTSTRRSSDKLDDEREKRRIEHDATVSKGIARIEQTVATLAANVADLAIKGAERTTAMDAMAANIARLADDIAEVRKRWHDDVNPRLQAHLVRITTVEGEVHALSVQVAAIAAQVAATLSARGPT